MRGRMERKWTCKAFESPWRDRDSANSIMGRFLLDGPSPSRGRSCGTRPPPHVAGAVEPGVRIRQTKEPREPLGAGWLRGFEGPPGGVEFSALGVVVIDFRGEKSRGNLP